uniref:GATA zinc finger domain-containing protein 10-like n=1 Tax=Drosophila rhopaloa TaxID=1041015 RepID=A0A6P4FJ31_DRORH
MQLNTQHLALIFLNLLRLGALANLQNNGRQKVLSDDFGPERDKSSARTQEDLRLRHEQHHLRQQQHQMAWEQQLQLQLQQHLQEQPQSRPVRHHQHKSQPMELAKEPIRQTASFGDDKAKTLVRRRSHYNEYENEDLELHTIQTGDEGRFSPRQWQQIEIAHRRMKEQHQLQLLAERQRQQPLLTTTTTTTTTKPNDTKSEDNNNLCWLQHVALVVQEDFKIFVN